MRSSSSSSLDDLFITLHQAARRFAGGISALARKLGKREKTLLSKLDPHDDLHQPTVGEFVQIVDMTGDLTPLSVLCEMLGAQLVTRTSETRQSVPMAVRHAASEHGDVMRAVEQALADGLIEASESAQIRREIQEARHALAVLENTLAERHAA